MTPMSSMPAWSVVLSVRFDIRRTNTHVRDVLDSGGSPISNIQFWRGSDAQGK